MRIARANPPLAPGTEPAEASTCEPRDREPAHDPRGVPEDLCGHRSIRTTCQEGRRGEGKEDFGIGTGMGSSSGDPGQTGIGDKVF